MSVSQDLKIDLIEQQYKSACCRRALLLGILFASAEVEGKSVTLSFEKKQVADFVSSLVREFYSKDTTAFRSESGGRRVLIAFDSASASKFVSNIDNLPDEYTVCDIINQKCSGCLSSFLRGVFIASGKFSDPQKQFSLEFTLGERTEIFAKILSDLTLTPHIAKRRGRKLLYFHTSGEIQDFFGYAAINHALFAIIDATIEASARKASQAFLNCVTNNYNKMAEVSERQIAIIKMLEEHNLLSSIPEELEKTARIRLENPDLPLSMLASMMTPAISKSGLSHRLKKIEELGAKLLKIEN